MYTRQMAEAHVKKMSGWDDPRVVEDPELNVDGSPIIYILAEDPQTGVTMVWDNPYEAQARTLTGVLNNIIGRKN